MALWSMPLPVAAQSRYPTSNADAPPGVYSAPRLAIDSLHALIDRDSLDYGANWRIAGALTTLGALAGDARRVMTRDSLYYLATRYARRAARIEPDHPEGHFMVAQLMGRLSRSASFRDRVARSAQALAAARRAIAADSLHDGAWHQLGIWHREASRLWKVQRLIATHFLGAEGMTDASWDQGIAALERAVALRPNWINYRLDLALAYIDRQRYSDAEAQLHKIADLSPIDPEDPIYVRDAARLSPWVAAKTVEAPRKASLLPFLRR